MDSTSGGCDVGYSIGIGVEGSACDIEISPGMTKYWRPICGNSLKPHVGQQFDSLDSAFGFYKQYDCRQSTTRKGRDGVIVLKHVVFTCNPSGMGVSSSCGCGGYGTPDPGIDGLSTSVGAFSSCKVVSTCPYPNPPDCISSHSLLESSLNVQFLKAGKEVMEQLYHEEKNWSSIELVCVLHPHLLAIDQCIDHYLTPVQIWAKWRLNHGSAASTPIIFLFNAFSEIYAVVFSKTHLHSFKISSNALAVLFVISICPFGRPRTAATSSAVIWIVCPFWSCNVQLLGSKLLTNHSPIWRGKLVIFRSKSLPSPMPFTVWRCAGLSCSIALVSIFGSAHIRRPSSSALVVSSLASVCSGISTLSAWAGCSSSICSRWGCCACSVGCCFSRSCPGSTVVVLGSLLVDVFPCPIAFLLLLT
nr:protein FAR1-RELATED SEQUENCE 5-like [Ipomoea batatas]